MYKYEKSFMNAVNEMVSCMRKLPDLYYSCEVYAVNSFLELLCLKVHKVGESYPLYMFYTFGEDSLILFVCKSSKYDADCLWDCLT